MPKYISSTEFAKMHGIPPTTIRQRCQRGSIPGAIKVGEGRRAMWCIPEDADPEIIDRRVKSGKYIDFRKHLGTSKTTDQQEPAEPAE